MNDPQKTPQGDPTSREPTDRPAQWILDLGMEIEAGRRPWLNLLAVAVLVLGMTVILLAIGGLVERGEPADPELAVLTDRLTSLATVLAVVLASVFVVSSVGYWFLCRHAYAAWRSLPENELDAIRRQRVEQLRRAIVALGGDDPDELTIRPEDLEHLSDRHRSLFEDLRACSRQAAEPILAVDQALGRPAPAHLEQALWQQTGTLLRQRRDWDSGHQVSPPTPAACLPCAVAADQCPTYADRRCRACGGQLHRIVVDEGFDTHPCSDRPGAIGSVAFLEHTAQLLGATLLAQPA